MNPNTCEPRNLFDPNTLQGYPIQAGHAFSPSWPLTKVTNSS
ncbi:hypothetical protein YPPY89_4133, partial [Yersinia pestis PY-89]